MKSCNARVSRPTRLLFVQTLTVGVLQLRGLSLRTSLGMVTLLPTGGANLAGESTVVRWRLSVGGLTSLAPEDHDTSKLKYKTYTLLGCWDEYLNNLVDHIEKYLNNLVDLLTLSWAIVWTVGQEPLTTLWTVKTRFEQLGELYRTNTWTF